MLPMLADAIDWATARRSAFRNESQTKKPLTPSESTTRTASLSARMRRGPRSTQEVHLQWRSVRLFSPVALVIALSRRFLRGFSGHAVAAGEPAPEVDGAAARRTERECCVFGPRPCGQSAGRATRHRVRW